MVSYGASVANDNELRLCGDVQGKRVVELGIGSPSNAVTFAVQGARSMAIDPSPERIAQLRRQAEQAEVTVQCHTGDLADLGFATSASVDLVVAANTLQDVDDLARLLRQVHRILKPGAPFIIATAHPVASMFHPSGPALQQAGPTVHHAYGETPARSISDLYMTLQRTNFHVDTMHELAAQNNRSAMWPAVLLLRVRKLGD
jgi:ubiquinone/menaquinone biosynthesis C-methylase UbiE